MKTKIVYFILILFAFAACRNQGNNATDEHDHDHETASIQYTAYDSGFEVFVEATPFVKGETSGILAHFTTLSNFKPLQAGTVTASLIIGSKGIRQKLEKPTRAGIYLFQLQPEASGTGRLIFDIKTADTTCSVTLRNVEVYADDHAAMHELEELAVENPGAITFTKAQSWKIGFATALPKTEPFGQVIKTIAHVQPAQGEEVILTAKTNGIVTFKENNLTEGSAVSPGKVLFYVSGEAFADNNPQVRLNEAKNNFERTEADYKRKSQLAKDKIVSEKELLISKNEYENATIIYQNLKKNFSKGGQNMVSPITGFIKHLYVSDRQYVETGAPLISVTQNKNLFLKAEVQQKYVSALPFIQSANIQSSLNNKVYTLEELNGRIISYGKNVSDENYLIPVTLQVENREGILPGSFIEVYLKTQSNAQALTVPNSALLEEQGNYFVFVQLTPESFEKREVTVGNSDGMKTEIRSGITGQNRVVTRGAILVKLAAVSNSLDPHAGHVH